MKIPDNKFQIFYDHEAGHYRVIMDGIDLSYGLGRGGIKVDFGSMKDDDFAMPEVTLTFPATGGLEITLADGSQIVEPGIEGKAVSL